MTFDASGFTAEVRYEDNWGTLQHDAQDSFGERYAYSPEGLVLRSTESGPTGEEITLKNGVHAVTSSYDEEGRLVQRTLLGEDGRPINGSDGYAYFIRDYHPSGHDADTVQTYYSAEGKPALSREGYSILIAQHDAHGNNTEVAFAGTDGKLIALKNGYAIVKTKIRRSWTRRFGRHFSTSTASQHIALSGLRERCLSYDQHNNIYRNAIILTLMASQQLTKAVLPK